MYLTGKPSPPGTGVYVIARFDSNSNPTKRIGLGSWSSSTITIKFKAPFATSTKFKIEIRCALIHLLSWRPYLSGGLPVLFILHNNKIISDEYSTGVQTIILGLQIFLDPISYTGLFFLLVGPKNDHETLRKFWHLELFRWDLKCKLPLCHFQGRTSKKNHPVEQ